ncbi:MAG: ADP-ribosylglycohydrolase family protein, partial [Methylococcaceae bacterium]
TCDDIRPTYKFNEFSQGTVPEAIVAFLDSTDFENAIRLAVSLGGDCDTLTCITGGIAQAFYGGVPSAIAEKSLSILDEHLRAVTVEFMKIYCHE